MSFTDQAICLRRIDYSETSLVLRMMTRQHGQVSLIAKGIKRPKSRLGGAIDLLAVGQAVFIMPQASSASTMGTLTGWSPAGWFPCLRTDLLRHATAMLAGEVLAKLTEELDPHPASFDAMVALLVALQAGDPPLRRLAAFARTLLADVGLTPGLERCVGCGAELADAETPGRRDAGTPRPPIVATFQLLTPAGKSEIRNPKSEMLFSGQRGGAYCQRCRPAAGESTVRISQGLHDFFTLQTEPGGRLALEIARWLVYYVGHQIGSELKTAASLERAISAALANLKSRQ